MAKSSESPKTLSEAIERLENAGQSKAKEIADILGKDYQEILKSLSDLKPFLSDLRGNVEQEASARKNQVEEKIKDSPWMTIAVTGVIAFILGWLIGKERK